MAVQIILAVVVGFGICFLLFCMWGFHSAPERNRARLAATRVERIVTTAAKRNRKLIEFPARLARPEGPGKRQNA
jgi:hypothetical protein